MPLNGDAYSSETELKFQLGQSAVDALTENAALEQPGERQSLRSIYYDTPEHELRNRGFSLRIREKDGRFIQTLKSRAGTGIFDRGEWESEVEGAAPDPTVLAKTPAGVALNGACEALAPIFETCVSRTVRIWRKDGAEVEVAVDEGEVISDGQSTPLRELELELIQGQPSALFELAHELAREAPMTLSFQSKAERGYRLAGHDGAAAIRGERSAISRKTTVEAAFRQIARECLVQIGGNAELISHSPGPAAVHQARVGLRRLRAAMTVFKPIVDEEGLARANAETRWLAGELEGARNLDVFADTFLAHGEEGSIENPEIAALHKRLVAAQVKAHAQAAEAVLSPRFSSLLLDLSRWIEVGAWSGLEATGEDRTSMVAEFGADRLRHLHRRVTKLGRELSDTTAVQRHRLRLKVKQLRYAAEFFGGAFAQAGTRTRYVAAAKELQDLLGQLNDLASARAAVLQIAGPRSTELGFTAGMIVAAQASNEAVLLKRANKAWETLVEAKRFWR